MTESALLYKFVTNIIVFIVLVALSLLIIYTKSNIPMDKIRPYGTPKYFTMLMLVIVSFWFLVYANVNKTLNGEAYLQETLYKCMTDYTYLELLLLLIMVLLLLTIIRSNILTNKIRPYVIKNYFAMFVLVVIPLWVLVYENINDILNGVDSSQEPLYKYLTNYSSFAVLLLLIIVSLLLITIYIKGDIMLENKTRPYGTLKYFTRYILVILLFCYFVYANINNTLNGTDNLQIAVVLFAFLSMFLITLDFEYTKNFNEIKDLILDSKIYVPFAQKVGDSNFEFERMVRAATTSIFIVGPNLAFLSKNREKMERLLLDKFRTNPKFEVRMLIMNPKNEGELNINKLGFANHFWRELNDSIIVFKEWEKETEKNNFKFDVRLTDDILTLSLLFRDKSTPEGCVLVTPIPNGSEGANRSCFLIRKKSYEMAFYDYYDAYNRIFNSEHSKSIKDVSTLIEGTEN